MERNWSKQVGPCNNRPFDEQTFKTISHLTRRLTVPVVSIAPFCQVLQILSSIHYLSHIICSSLEPALPKEHLSQHSFCFCCPYILSKEMFEGPFDKISSQVFAFNNFVLLCRDCFCSRVSSLPLSCVQVNRASLQVNDLTTKHCQRHNGPEG